MVTITMMTMAEIPKPSVSQAFFYTVNMHDLI